MNKKDIAWESLTSLERAQLIKFYPELDEPKEKKGEEYDREKETRNE